MSAQAVTIAEAAAPQAGEAARFGDGTCGEVAFSAPSGSYAPDFVGWPSDVYDGLVVRDVLADLVHLPLASFRNGEVFWGKEP